MDARRTTVYNLPPELAEHPQYEVLRELGSGGMGVVYLAKNKLMDRLEVLKVVNKALLDRPGSVERFLREIRSAAKLNHPNVVAAYSALQIGELLVFAMEYVEGDDLAALVKARGPLPVAHACNYVQQAAIGLQHAFEKGMVHRDIKPQNLILAREGKKHIVKVLDFGLAKATQEKDLDAGLTGVGATPGARVTRLAELTGAGQMMGTPGYVAPEQTVDAAKADSRADIYSLGCTLYFLLTGQPPYRGKNLAEILHAHQTAEAQPLNLVRPEVPEELAAVVRKMMAKETAQRYQTPAEVVQALGVAGKLAAKGTTPKSSPDVTAPTAKERSDEEKRLLRAETIALSPQAAQATVLGPNATPGDTRNILSAKTILPFQARQAVGGRKPPSAAVKPTTWKTWLIGAAVAAVLLLGLLGLWAGGVFKVKTKNGTMVLENVPAAAEVVVDGETITLRDRDGEPIEIRVAAGRKHQLQVKKTGFKVFSEEVEIDAGSSRAILVRLQPEPTTVENSQPFDAPPPVKPKAEDAPPPTKPKPEDPPPPRPTQPVPAVAAGDYDLTGGYRFVHFGKDGTRVLLLFNDDKQKQYFARVYDLATGQILTPPLKHVSKVRHASFSPDGQRVVTASLDKTARLWDTATGKEVTPPLKHESGVVHASFSPDGQRVVTASFDKTARLWDAATGKEVTPPLKHENTVVHASFSPDGQRVVTASNDQTARLWDTATGKEVTPPLKHEGALLYASFSPDGQRVVTAGYDKTARLWDAATGKEVTPPLKHENSVWHASFSPDGQRLVTASEDKTVRLWDAATGQALTPPLKHEDRVLCASFSPDGQRVVTASSDKTARLWDAATGKLVTPPLKHGNNVFYASFSPDGKRVVTVNTDNTAPLMMTARLWDTATGEELKKVTIAPAAVSAGDYDRTGGYRFVHFGKDRTRVVLVFDVNKQKQDFARVYDLATGQALTPPLKHGNRVTHASFSPDGTRVVTASADNTARLWDAATGRALTPPLRHAGLAFHASFSPDGQLVVTASMDNTARVWDATTGQPLTPPLKHVYDLRNVAHVIHASFSPDSQRVVTASADMTARLWDAATGKEVTPPLKHESYVRHASFSPDGQRVVTSSRDHTARLWDAATGKEVTLPLKHKSWLLHASFSPDGTRVVTASSDKTARMWDAATGQALTPPLKHEDSVVRASFSPDGMRVVTASFDKTARLWDATTGQEVTPPLKHEDAVYHASFSPDGQRVVTFCWDNTARLWDAATGKELKKVTITPD